MEIDLLLSSAVPPARTNLDGAAFGEFGAQEV